MNAPFFPSQNRHHLTVEQHGRTDFERLTDIAADAIGAMRDALDQLDAQDAKSSLRQRCLREELRQFLAADTALTEGARRQLSALIAALDEGNDDHDPGAFEKARNALSRARRDADRVADLLAAEAHIRRCRRS